MTITFSDLSRAQAQEFCDHVVAREDARLGDLARWVLSTGGPLGELDGSLESLVPLWEWFVTFMDVGCPGVPEGVLPSEARSFGEQGRDWASDRELFAGESIAHYVLRVVQRVDRTAHWAVHHQRKNAFRHRTSIIADSLKIAVVIDVPLSNMIGSVRRGDSRSAEDTKLHFVVCANLGWQQNTPVTPRGPSILSPYLQQPAVPWDDPGRVPPRFVGRIAMPVVVPRPRATRASEMILAHPEAHGRTFRDAAPLPEERIANLLSRLGFTTPGGKPVTAKALTASQKEFHHRDDSAAIVSLGAAGRLHAISVGHIRGTQEEWDSITQRITTFATETGLRFASREEFAPAAGSETETVTDFASMSEEQGATFLKVFRHAMLEHNPERTWEDATESIQEFAREQDMRLPASFDFSEVTNLEEVMSQNKPPSTPQATPRTSGGQVAISLMILAHPEAKIEDFDDAVPLPEHDIAAALTDLGFTYPDGAPITVTALQDEHGEFLHNDQVAFVETIGAAGRLRAVSVDPLDCSERQWEAIVTRFAEISTTHGLRFATEDEFSADRDDS